VIAYPHAKARSVRTGFIIFYSGTLSGYVNKSIMRARLEDIYQQIIAEKKVEPLRNLVLFSFLPFIEGNYIIKNEFDRRANYYPKLAKSNEYLSLIDSIHTALKQIYEQIDISLLLNREEAMKDCFRREDEDRGILSLEDFHSALVNSKKWFYLGQEEQIAFTIHGEEITINKKIDLGSLTDSVRAPWQRVFSQYEQLDRFFRIVEYHGAFKNIQVLNPILSKIVDDISALKTMLYVPTQSLHTTCFEMLEQYTESPMLLHDEKGIAKVKEFVERITKDLDLFLQENDILQTSQIDVVKQKFSLKYEYKYNTFIYNKTSRDFPLDRSFSSLCHIFYSSCPKSGKMEWNKVVELMKENGDSRIIDREQVRLWIRSFNTWIRGRRFGFGDRLSSDVLKLQGTEIKRLR
jgi:hypothetical protein